DEQRLGPWLYQITRNTITDHYRKRRLDRAPLDAVDPPEPDNEPDAAERLAAGLQPMIEQLPDKYRSALMLTEFDGLTQAQMGERLGLSISGAKSRVQRAREMLKADLLACCHFEFDTRGRVIEYEAQRRCCDTVT
ncbi:MAG: sigma-70 family RNA polymerase sigma factor, partial [Acidimicrobiia bacterium]|nr:sigma-70 family RNA polymerase sigma factor [Acidimicrobiia bacterium]